MKLEETSIVQTYKTEYETLMGLEVDQWQVPFIFEGIMTATADYMHDIKKKNQKVSMSFLDGAGNFIMAAVVGYNKNPGEGQDNWNYTFTFDEEDIKDVPAGNKHDSTETYFHAKIVKRLLEKTLRVNESTWINPMIALMATSIVSFLDQNVKPDEEVTLESEGYFIASVKIEDDKPAKALVPDDSMKVIVKHDADTQKEAA